MGVSDCPTPSLTPSSFPSGMVPFTYQPGWSVVPGSLIKHEPDVTVRVLSGVTDVSISACGGKRRPSMCRGLTQSVDVLRSKDHSSLARREFRFQTALGHGRSIGFGWLFCLLLFPACWPACRHQTCQPLHTWEPVALATSPFREQVEYTLLLLFSGEPQLVLLLPVYVLHSGCFLQGVFQFTNSLFSCVYF